MLFRRTNNHVATELTDSRCQKEKQALKYFEGSFQSNVLEKAGSDRQNFGRPFLIFEWVNTKRFSKQKLLRHVKSISTSTLRNVSFDASKDGKNTEDLRTAHRYVHLSVDTTRDKKIDPFGWIFENALHRGSKYDTIQRSSTYDASQKSLEHWFHLCTK